MKTTQRPVSGLNALSAACLAIATSITVYTPAVNAHSNGAVWGIGGLLAGSMLTKAVDTRHESQPKQSARAPTPAPAPAAPMTAEQKIQQLNTLAAGGYITPQEYKTEKQAILNSIVE